MTRNTRIDQSHPWPTLNRLMLNETIVNAMISIPMYLLTAWLTFPQTQPIPLWGLHGVAFDLIPATFIPAIIIALATTLGLRARIRKGMTAAGRFSPPLPRRLPLRVLVLGGGALIVMVPITVLALSATWGGPWTWPNMMLFKVVYAVCISVVLTPVVVMAALRFDVPPKASM